MRRVGCDDGRWAGGRLGRGEMERVRRIRLPRRKGVRMARWSSVVLYGKIVHISTEVRKRQ